MSRREPHVRDQEQVLREQPCDAFKVWLTLASPSEAHGCSRRRRTCSGPSGPLISGSPGTKIGNTRLLPQPPKGKITKWWLRKKTHVFPRDLSNEVIETNKRYHSIRCQGHLIHPFLALLESNGERLDKNLSAPIFYWFPLLTSFWKESVPRLETWTGKTEKGNGRQWPWLVFF